MNIYLRTSLAIVILCAGFAGGYAFRSVSYPAPVTQETTNGHMMPDGTMMGDMQGSMGSMTSSLVGKTGDALDKAFIDDMIIHHQGAVDMARLLLNGTQRPELIKLGNDIITAQTDEIAMMQQWRTQWFGE